MRTFIYVRVSTQGQVDNGLGLDVQEDQCRKYAERLGGRVYDVFREEGVSGTKSLEERPVLTDVLAELEEDDVLLVARLDRLARQLTVQEAILATVWQRECSVHTADLGEVLRDDPDDPMRTAMRQMAGVFAELDRAMLVKRLRDGRQKRKALGGKGEGRWASGWRAGGVADPREQAVLAFIRSHAEGGATLKQISERLNNRPNFQPRNSARWTPQNLSVLMRNAGIHKKVS